MQLMGLGATQNFRELYFYFRNVRDASLAIAPAWKETKNASAGGNYDHIKCLKMMRRKNFKMSDEICNFLTVRRNNFMK